MNAETWNLNPTTRFEKGFITDMDEYQKVILDVSLEGSATFVSEANNIIIKDITLKVLYKFK